MRHRLDIALPLIEQSWIVQDQGNLGLSGLDASQSDVKWFAYKARAMSGRIADLTALQDRKLALDTAGLLNRR